VPRVALFPTCLVDVMRPSVGFAAARLIEQAGFAVTVPEGLTCCGQPAFNSGDRKTARALARRTMTALAGFDFVVLPSGSCAGMMVKHYPELFEAGSADQTAALALAARTHELTAFLVHIAKVDTLASEFPARATYHDSCAGLRELGIKSEPRQLLKQVAGVSLMEMEDAEVCCGFGGTFCVKYPEISTRMTDKKVERIIASGADTVVAGDLGCLMTMAGRLKRLGSDIRVRHVAEVLAGDYATPPLAEDDGDAA
jgi:L-lactate dehydrogenase complex protein LldE